MGFFDFLKADKEEDIHVKETAHKLMEIMARDSVTHRIGFHLEEGETYPIDSKIGGAYYSPYDMEVPVNPETNVRLNFLAQINFGQLPHLHGFPERGLLQFFIEDDDCFGINFDSLNEQTSWRVRFIEDVPNQIYEYEIIEDELTEYSTMPFPWDVCYKLIPETEHQAIPYGEYRYEKYLERAIMEAGCYEEMQDEDFRSDVEDVIIDNSDFGTTQIGGYPYFVQGDIREEKRYSDKDVLLFSINSDEDIMWGDLGIANFLISSEDLLSGDFSDVVYTWDCG